MKILGKCNIFYVKCKLVKIQDKGVILSGVYYWTPFIQLYIWYFWIHPEFDQSNSPIVLENVFNSKNPFSCNDRQKTNTTLTRNRYPIDQNGKQIFIFLKKVWFITLLSIRDQNVRN